MTVIPPTVPAKKRTAIRLNILVLRLARSWLRVALVVIGIYTALPFVTPALMKLGIEGPARVLYSLYSPFCHQFAFRSLFLFGDQPAYPRALTGTSQTPFEVYAASDPTFVERYQYWYRYYTEEEPGPVTVETLQDFTPWLQFAARDFVGNPQMGYKMTLCARDIAIYSGIFLGGLIYSRPQVRRRLRPVPLWLYALLGLGPIGIDGFSQLLSYPPFNLWPPRETLPIFRLVTGFIFGLMNVWLAFPYLEASFRETRDQLELKLAQVGIIVR